MPADSDFHLNKRYILLALVLLLALYIILPQVGQFKSSLHLMSHPAPGWTIAAIGFTFLTYTAAAATYCLLAFKRLNYGVTLLVQFAAMFINRLLPGGIGALGANFIYLKKQRHSSTQAGSVVAINNLLGAIGHYTLLGVVLLITGYSTIKANQTETSFGSNIKYVLIIILGIIIIGLIVGRKRFKSGLIDLKNQLLDYRHRPGNLLGALLTSICLTTLNILSLYACSMAFGVNLNFAIIMLVFTLGIGAGTATPTPGGLGGFEAGLVAGFASFKIDASTALAIALLYRLISYWLTLGAGAVAFVLAQRRQLL